MYFTTYTSVRREMVDEGVRSTLSQQHRQGRDNLLRAEGRARQVPGVARVADAQATMLRRASKQRAMLQLPEAETRANILREEGQERCRVMWEAAWAKRHREMDIWETRCLVAVQQVYWGMVEKLGRWAVGTMQRRLSKVILRQHQWTWDQGWLQFWA